MVVVVVYIQCPAGVKQSDGLPRLTSLAGFSHMKKTMGDEGQGREAEKDDGRQETAPGIRRTPGGSAKII